MDFSFITTQSQTVQGLISIIIPLLIALIKGIIIATTVLKKLPTKAKIGGAIGVMIGSLLFQLSLIAFFIYMQWFQLPSFVMFFFGGVAAKTLLVLFGVIGRGAARTLSAAATGLSYAPGLVGIGGKRRKHKR